MGEPYILHTGIFFNGIISGIVGTTAIALAIFLLHRWKRLSHAMKAYAWFWLMTAITWLATSIRYFFVSSDYNGVGISVMTILAQGAIAASGPALLYYFCTHRQFQKFWVLSLPLLAGVLGAIALWVDTEPGGILFQQTTYFSAEISLNLFSFSIFLLLTTIIFLLAIRDIYHFLNLYKKKRELKFLYEALYSIAIALYLLLGSIEEAGMVSSWPVLIFRSLYIVTFLYVYLIMEKSDSTFDNYLVDTKPLTPH